jgi:D-amino-acid dehydrogenase
MGRTIVIGAGVIGLACARELRKRGDDVLVVDRGRPGAACSSGNAGWVVPAMSAPIPAPGLVGTSLRWMLRRDSPLYIRPRLDPRFAGWLWRFWRNCRPGPHRAGLNAVAGLNRRTMALFDELRADGVDFEMHRRGLLYLGLSRESVAHAAHEVQQLGQIGYLLPDILSADEVRDLEPAVSRAVAGGFLLPDERHVRPESLTAGLVRALTEHDVTIESDIDVIGADLRDGGVTAVRTNGGSLEVERVLIAAGAWTGELAGRFGARLPIEAGKGYSITVDQPERPPDHPLDLIEARVACTPFDGALRLAGTMELSGTNLTLRAERVDAIRRAGKRYLGRSWSGGREQVWVGMRPLTPDGLPVIGRLPGLANAWVASGHAMLGVTLAPATAEVVVRQMHGEETGVDDAAFDPGRFARTTNGN